MRATAAERGDLSAADNGPVSFGADTDSAVGMPLMAKPVPTLEPLPESGALMGGAEAET
jgi:hypothetical protein